MRVADCFLPLTCKLKQEAALLTLSFTSSLMDVNYCRALTDLSQSSCINKFDMNI